MLAIKALSFAKMGGDRRAAVRLQSIAYCAGVVASFLLLAALLLALRAAGTYSLRRSEVEIDVLLARGNFHLLRVRRERMLVENDHDCPPVWLWRGSSGARQCLSTGRTITDA